MNASLISLLTTLATCREVRAYLRTQRRAAEIARASHQALLSIATGHADPAIRSEALQIVSLLATPGHQGALELAHATDPDPAVRACAEALVFRSIVAERVQASGKFDAEGFAEYRRNVAKEAAMVIIRAR